MVNINNLIFLLNELNKILDNAKTNDGEIVYNISRDKYEKLNDSYNELLKLVKEIKDKNAK
jgi:hypothetical protein